MGELDIAFPLEPKDCQGNVLHVGDHVKVLSMPHWLTQDMDESRKQLAEQSIHRALPLLEFDGFGYAWVNLALPVTSEQSGASEYIQFCLEPSCLLKAN